MAWGLEHWKVVHTELQPSPWGWEKRGQVSGERGEQKARPRVDLGRKLPFLPPSDPVPPLSIGHLGYKQ